MEKNIARQTDRQKPVYESIKQVQFNGGYAAKKKIQLRIIFLLW